MTDRWLVERIENGKGKVIYRTEIEGDAWRATEELSKIVYPDPIVRSYRVTKESK